MDQVISANREHWNRKSAAYQEAHDQAIGSAPKLWGVHALPDELLGALGSTAELDVLELGCGAGQWSASMAEEGARVVGLDLSEAQLSAARERDQRLALVHAAGQALPFAPESFDLVFCDHGAIGWADPAVTLPEVCRVLRVGGRLVFNVASPFIELCWDDRIAGVGTSLRADYFGLYDFVGGDGATYYTLGYGDWIRLLRAHRLAVEDLIEPRPPDARPNTYWNSEPADWFTRWPAESLWVTRRES